MQAASKTLLNPDYAVTELRIDDHRTLIQRIADHRDRDAFEALFVHFGPRVKSMMLQAGATHDLAEDLVQDVMMTVWRKVHLYAPERGAVSTWIYTIARNARIDRLRRGSSQSYEDLETVEIASQEGDGEDETFANQRAEQVAQALADLPDDQREVIEYSFVRDMTQSEIADELSLPLGTVKSRMRLAYAKLKGKLEGLL